jgi:hypothetical protein
MLQVLGWPYSAPIDVHDLNWTPSPGPSMKRKSSPLPKPAKKKGPSIKRSMSTVLLDTSHAESSVSKDTCSETLSDAEDNHPKMEGVETHNGS